MAMRFEPATDIQKIRSVATHPRLYRHLHDDDAPSPEEWTPTIHPLVSWTLVYDGNELIGLFIVSACSRFLWEIHEAFLPCAWGERAIRATIEFREWIWRENKTVKRLFGQIVRSNRLALRFAKAAGMTEFGVHPRSFMKGGIMQDQILVGIDRPEEV